MTITKPPFSICVYCGASFGAEPAYTALAASLGTEIARRGMRLVYGGGAVGLMGVVARATQAEGGPVLGVIPRFLAEREILLKDIAPVIVETMHERKALMYHEADAFAVLPGGVGTLEEAIEVISWARLDLHAKPIIFIDPDGFWAPLLDLLTHFVEQGFAAPDLSLLWESAPNAAAALDWIEIHTATRGEGTDGSVI